MGNWRHRGVFALWATGFFVFGVVVGGWLAARYFFSGSPPPPSDLPLSSLLEKSHALLDKGELAEAEKIYRAILARDEGNVEALTHLGNIEFDRGDVGKALAYYDEALRREPSYAHALWDKGIALRAKGDDAGAIVAWESFARLFPADSSDVIQVKKWIAEAKARLASASLIPPKSF